MTTSSSFHRGHVGRPVPPTVSSPHAPSVPAIDVELPDAPPVAQVVATWRGTVFGVHHVGQGRPEEARSDYVVGEGPSVDFPLGGADLPSAAGFPLVQRDADGIHVQLTSTMQARLRVDDGPWRHVDRSEGGVRRLRIPIGADVRVRAGDAVFAISVVPPGRHLDARAPVDRPFWISSGLSLLGIGSLLVMAQLVPDVPRGLTLDDVLSDQRFVGYHEVPDEEDEQEIDTDADKPSEDAGGQGQRHTGAEGKMGDPSEKQPTGVYAMAGPRDALPEMARQFDPQMLASKSGILGVMQRMPGSFIASPYANAFQVGNDDEDVWGGFIGDEVAAAYGVGGMGLLGTGRGGGGTAEGLLGLGNVGTIGKGAGGGNGNSYGPGDGSGTGGAGTGFRDRVKRRPTVAIARPPKAEGMDKDVIRRIVRSHINEVRYCYNQGLTRDPNLRGRVAVQFTIGPTGGVGLSVVENTSVKDQNVGRCIAKAVKRWRFPRPAKGGGTAVVTYPFVLNPG